MWLLIGIAVFLAAGTVGLVASQRAALVVEPPKTDEEQLAAARRAIETKAFAEAVRAARAVTPASAASPDARVLEGIGLWRLHRWQAAEQAWKAALAANPQVERAAWQLLHVYFIQQRFAEAEELALRVYPIEPEPRDRTLLLLELVRQDNERLGPEATARELEPVTILEPDNASALRALGTTFVQLRRFTDGAALIERAHAIDPDSEESQFARVWYLYETGQTERLKEVFDELPAARREQARFQRYRGMWAEAVDDAAEAERAYRAAIERDPADRKAHYQLARLLRARGSESDAAEHEAASRRLDDAREQLAACYQRALQANHDPPADLCREFSRWCAELGRTRQAKFWDDEASRRPAAGR
jgi:tetratricopeptide (TPR) repeat protein